MKSRSQFSTNLIIEGKLIKWLSTCPFTGGKREALFEQFPELVCKIIPHQVFADDLAVFIQEQV
jgi:hypothetical protein